MHEAGKGSKRRPEDSQAFADNYDRIFGDKRPERGSFVWDEQLNKFVPKAEYQRQSSNAPMIMPDIQPYQSMQTGEMIMSRSRHREHLRQHGLIEVGNEPIRERKPEIKLPDLKADIAKHFYK